MKETKTVAKEVVHHDHANHHKDRLLSIETLINFLDTRQYRHLTATQLNKILSLHGLKQSKHRKDAEEIFSTVTEPIHPARSTVNDRYKSSTSSKGEITLAEAMKDLKSLNWQMCSVTSIKTISSKKYSNPATLSDSISASEVAAKLMSLKGIKRQIASEATSMMSNDNKEPGSGKPKKPRSDGCKPMESGYNSVGDVPLTDIVVCVNETRQGVNRVYLKNLYTSDDANTLPPGST